MCNGIYVTFEHVCSDAETTCARQRQDCGSNAITVDAMQTHMLRSWVY